MEHAYYPGNGLAEELRKLSKKLIINADGLGFTPGVDKGIWETARFGLVKSTSAVPNFDSPENIGKFAREFPHVSIGVHFNLSVGIPVSPIGKIPSLINPDNGEFWGAELPRRLMTGEIKSDHMRMELSAQVQRLLDLGATITHFDGHQNKHLYPPFFAAAVEVAKEHSIFRMRCPRRLLTGTRSEKILYYLKNPQRLFTHSAGAILAHRARSNRIAMADRLISPGYADSSHKSYLDSWLQVARTLPDGVNEIYCHPGYPDEALRKYASYVEPRLTEVKVLTSNELEAVFEDFRIELISFNDL